MNKRTVLISLLILILFCATYTTAATISIKNNLWKVYALALETFIPLDEGLNHDMKYIAIDTGSLKGLDRKQKDLVLGFFKKRYKINVLDASFNELKKKGMVKDANYLEGILLVVEQTRNYTNLIIEVQGYKFRSGKGATGVKTNVYYFLGIWDAGLGRGTWMS